MQSDVADLIARNQERLSEAKRLLSAIGAAPENSRETILMPLNELGLQLANAGAECGLLSEVHPDPAVREAAEEIERETSRFGTELLQHRGLYDALGALSDLSTLDVLERRVVDVTRRDMRRSGVELSEAGQDRVRALRAELVSVGQEFGRNIRDDVKEILVGPADLAGLPADYVDGHPADPDGKIRITTNYPDYIPFMSYSESGDARHALMRAANTRAVPTNLLALDQILTKRHELAQLLGHRTWADYATEDKMVGSAGAARTFINRVFDATTAGSAAERARLLAARARDGVDSNEIADFEMAYYTERVKTEELNFDARSVRAYFEYRAVSKAVLELNSELFGMTFTRVDEALWHPSVETFDVAIDGRPAGRISLDMFPREGKYKHAACFTYRQGVGGKQLPHFVLVCNFPDPAAQEGPALMEHGEVVTYFHEFGHLVHSITRGSVPWTRLGSVAEWDFVEAPSQFLEEWIYDLDVLRRFARHFQTGERITKDLVERLRAARDFGRGLFVQRQLFFAALSLEYHDRDPRDLDTTALMFELAERYSPSRVDPESRFQASFGHLEGYGSNYYTYQWSAVISRDLLTAFKNGLLDTAQLRRYRDLVLAPGGTKPAAELIEDFLGRPFNFDAYGRWLKGA